MLIDFPYDFLLLYICSQWIVDNQYPAVQEVLCVVLYNVLKFDQVLEIRSLITLHNVIGQHRSNGDDC